MTEGKRRGGQFPVPVRRPAKERKGYDIYPSFRIGENQIFHGYESLAELILQHRIVLIDGYAGVYFDHIHNRIDYELRRKGTRVRWINTSDFLRPEDEIIGLTAPFTGGTDPLFGTRCNLNLKDFFISSEFMPVSHGEAYDICIIIGTGASLSAAQGLLIYIDLPKNELQYRARERKIFNLGLSTADDPKVMYKRSYFIDWPVLNRHKQSLLHKVDILLDGQRKDDPVWICGDDFRKAINTMSRNFFRVRPWFEPGPWGGTWIKDRIEGLNHEVPNYAWSFELITPENGLLLESSSLLLEASFDCLMFLEGEAVLGDCYHRFGAEFPIRFDFLDTYDGGNLSIQCHPRPEYTKKHFGESFTQEETYYIIDTKDNAVVYLGFQDNINPDDYRRALKKSAETLQPLDVDRYIRKHPASKHDLFLIPYGTAHGSGQNNLVLEISSTPYIFTFKMYDWLRMDLNGKPRDLNIDRAMENLYFDIKGNYVTDHLKSKPYVLNEGKDWQLWHLPTHESHFYDVHRYTFETSIDIQTQNKCLVMSLVEGDSILVKTLSGVSQQFNYAETFVIPAAAGSVRIKNLSGGKALLIKAFVK
ncbi:MAG: class I mannose-6-phosphate isomerase [Bacteroidales bacterium]|jgi:mannose-6-phosphate isomerase class I|nr:class I mannose-6-phosphate isomerase [Bacteroidales bacterium]